jgi:hypothetical protein
MKLLPRSSPVPLHRRWIGDVVHFGKKSHSVGCNWTINVASAAQARRTRNPPVSWAAIWVRAMALASRKWPELRTCYLPFPWPRMYTHPSTTAVLVVEREWRGALAVFFDTIKNPESRSIAEIELIFQSLREVEVFIAAHPEDDRRQYLSVLSASEHDCILARGLPIENVGAFRRLIPPPYQIDLAM